MNRKETMVKLSNRLAAIAKLIEGRTCADIGCDHGLLPAFLLSTGQIDTCIATDISPGPLSAATENLRRLSLLDRAHTRLGAGLLPVSPGEAETCVISGMGGMNIIGIFADSPQVAASFRQLILQPERDAEALRRFLHTQYFFISREIYIFDRGHYYVCMDARPGGEPPYSDLGYIFGERPLRGKDPILRLFLEKEAKRIRALISRTAEGAESPAPLTRFLTACLRALEVYYNVLI